jgi:hypothetical protein
MEDSMKRPVVAAFLSSAAMLLALGAPRALPQQKFKPGCTVPFEPTPKIRPIDNTCRNAGEFEDNATPEHEAQNRAKNMLCAVGTDGQVQQDPIPVSLATFDDLQENVLEAEIDFGSSDNLPKDRSLLKDIGMNPSGVTVGEGSYVVFVGYMLENHATGKESVNCGATGVRNYDIHIALVGQGMTNACKSVTAEVIPHYRPDAWYKTYYAQYYSALQSHPWRVKGHLFFDGSHRPCGDPLKKDNDPKRRSSWEIHPVYSMDVCKNTTLAACKADDESKWTPMSEWIVSH